MRASVRLVLLACLATAATLLAAAPAQAASPWWQLSIGARPANIQPGTATDAVQQLTVKASGGSFFLIYPGSFGNLPGSFGNLHPQETTASLPYDASHQEVQEALEGLPRIGAGNVEVSGGLGDETGSHPYTITFLGALADQPIQMLAANESSLIGTGKEAKLSELVAGRADGEVVLLAENVGDAFASGEGAPVTISDALPPGLQATGIAATAPFGSLQRQPVGCRLATLSCSFEGRLAPYDSLEVRIAVDVQPGAEPSESDEATVEGGNAAPASLARPLSLTGAPAPFGVADFRVRFEREGGALDKRAGAHPFQMTTDVAINQAPDVAPLEAEKPNALPAVLPKDVITRLPVGFIGDPVPFETCSLAQFLTNVAGETNLCPAASALGVSSVEAHEPHLLGSFAFAAPLFNLEPYFGEPARLGFFIAIGNVPVVLDTSLRAGAGEGALPEQSEDYGLNVNAFNVSQTAGLSSARVTVWGVPGASAHDNSRGWNCLYQARETFTGPCESPVQPHPRAFLTTPTSCAGPMAASVEADPWQSPGDFSDYLPSEALPTLKECNKLPFAPTIQSEPTTGAASSPTGLNFELSIPNEGLTSSNEGALASSELKKAVVTLPEGFTTNPSVAEGLKACSAAEFHATTIEPGSGCTEESKVGSAEIESPVVKQAVRGSLYVAKQTENPYDNLLTLYLVLRNPELGVLVKQALKVVPDEHTGQLTTEVDDIPQLPFSHFKLSFRQGQRSPLVTPPACGDYAVKALLYPWASPETPVPVESPSFQITSGPEGQGCPSGGLPPFHPELLAGSINPTAGAYTPFYADITRRDSEQEITHFSIKLPPGVVGKLAGVAQCSDAQIAAAKAREHEGGGGEEEASPSCPAASQIGHTDVGTGVGNVLAYAPGKLYLAGPYHGSSLSIVSITAAKVGPFDLGTVVVREALRVNPETAEVFVDATGSDPIPHIVDGIPVHLRDIQVFVDRPEFVLNPTSCAKTSTASTVLGSGLNFASEADDVPVTVTSPFQVGSCASLPFAPQLKLALLGGSKRAAHPRLKATLHMNGVGEAAISKAQVTLPKSEFLDQGHLNNICTRVQFKEGNGNGEKCPPASVYGWARAVTPILSEPLEGPVFLRSSEHQLPDLVAALRGNEISVDLDGRIDSLHGQIRNTFETVPDAPVTSFTLEMQGGSKGLLINSTNLCKGTHKAIVNFTAHNGKVHDFNPALQAKCPKGKGKGRHHKRRARHRATH